MYLLWLLQTGSYRDFICFDLRDNKGFLLHPFSCISIFVFDIAYWRTYTLQLLTGYLCSYTYCKRRWFEETIQGVDFCRFIDYIRITSSYLCSAKQSAADFIQKSWFSHVLNAEPDKTILYCFVYVYNFGVCYSTSATWIQVD